jgi:hypothetical protein
MTEVTNFINTLTDKTPQNIRTQIYKRGIVSSYHPTDGRMVFSAPKSQRFNDSDSLGRECNGLVFDTRNMKPLVIPQQLHRTNINVSIVNGYISQNMYDILYTCDGTVINLYWLESENMWCISTARSYDLTNVKWGALSYKDVLSNILGTNNDKFYELLNKSYSYTFGIKYDETHPFRGCGNIPINTIWFIQSTNLDNKDVSYEFSNTIGIQNQQKIDYPIDDIKTIFSNLSKALDNYVLYKHQPLYGYILRSKQPDVTKQYSNILLESSLMQKIRQLQYHKSFNIMSKKMNYNRNTYILISSYLDINKHMLFIKLFPQFLPAFNKLNDITANLVRSVISYAKNNNNSSFTTEVESMQLYIKTIYNTFSSYHGIVFNNTNVSKMITSFLRSATWVDMYYTLYTMDN